MKAIVLIARGLQLGALGCYGNQWIDTPALDELAAEGVVFDQHFADCADPAGARRAWRSGRYHLPTSAPHAETGTDPDLLAALRAQGIHTCLIVDDSRPAPPDFAIGWDEVERVAASAETTPLEATLEAAGAALLRLEPRDNWLMWIDLATPLPPWNVPDEFQEPYFSDEPIEEDEDGGEEDEAEESEPLTPLTEPANGAIDPEDDPLYLSLQTSYAAAVTYLDAGVGQLLEALHNLNGGDEILIVFTTDIGQNLGEHGIVGPIRAWLHDELIHLPLIVRLPGGAEAGRRVSALTQTVDLAPTLAKWFQMPLSGMHGGSLLPLVRGETEVIRPYACTALQVGEAIEYALRTPDWAFLLPVQASADAAVRSPQLYVKPDDRWEVNNVLQHHPELVEQLERTLRDRAGL
ncbi:MAG TPA: sulfatase-like hydrolase/transferase [Gemmataceae bacterium]|nr:sulfatase-like hydrolase/transferase [Gemmataceae bacterium]